MRYLLSSLFFFLSTSAVVVAQTTRSADDESPMRYGLYGGYNLNLHTASFRELPGIPNCCPRFESGLGSGFAGGGLVELPLSQKLLLDLRIGLAQHNGVLSATEPTGVILNGIPRTGEFEHTVDATLTTVGIDPMVGYRITERLIARAGFRAGVLLAKTFAQKEQITQPEGRGTFVDGNGNDTHSRTRNEASSDIPNASAFQASIQAGVSYDLPLNKQQTLMAAPEILYSLPITGVLKDGGWQVHSLRFGIALKYGARRGTEILPGMDHIDTLRVPIIANGKLRMVSGVATVRYDTVRSGKDMVLYRSITRVDTMFIPVPESAPTAALSVQAVYEDGTKEAVAGIRITSQFVTEALPLLPYVFFSERSDGIAEQYRNRSSSPESDDKTISDPLHFHRNVLNIVGERMSKFSGTTVVLRGTADPTRENGDCALAQRRAKAVKTYLMEQWRIAEERIIIEQLPSDCRPRSLTESPQNEGYAENRRVEISSPDGRVLEPLLCKRYSEVQEVTPPVIELDPTGSSVDNIRNWQVQAQQAEQLVFSEKGSGAPGKMRQAITPQQAAGLQDKANIAIRLVVANAHGTKAETVQTIPVRRDTSDIEIHRMSLILFDVSESIIKENAKTEIMSFLSNIGENDKVTVVGFTDKLGIEEENHKLAERRAQAICQFVRQFVPAAHIVQCVGVAYTQFPAHIQSYNTPEERFLSRIVQIEIQRQRNKLY